ncbi:MAG: arginine N-succinyltransferase [Deltaproteobacteria bacterium]|nr:arginine N-succinyltransferase [Deltaproteobacteria bacterium]MCW5808125.1 arginine N-succinyltransferase [Deltaproteobacteria bacterium]
MFRIRQSYREDVDQVLAVAEHLDTVNLPADREHIETILERSEKSFNAEVPVVDREFLFVLEDLTKKKVIGTSIIYAQHGTRKAPHIFFRVENDERYSVTLDKHMVHQTLRIGYNYDGPTEIGGLILMPEYRRTPGESLGKALSYVRFLFMRMHRQLFRDRVLSELLPPLEQDGTSRLWEALGRKFTGLTYQDADVRSKNNKEFIHALFPDDPIHTELLPDDVRALIGQVGPETKGVEAMLRRIGFEYAGQIDPFDGGPHFTARTDEITIVNEAREAPVRTVGDADGERPWAVLAIELPNQRPRFRAIGARVIPMDDGTIGITDDARKRLGVEDGQRVWMTYG